MAIQGNVEIKAEEAALKNAADTLKSRIQGMKTSYESIMSRVENTRKYWIGVAGDAHRNAFLEEREDIEQIIRRLSEHPDDLLKIAGIYVEAENAVTQMPSAANTSPLD